MLENKDTEGTLTIEKMKELWRKVEALSEPLPSWEVTEEQMNHMIANGIPKDRFTRNGKPV